MATKLHSAVSSGSRHPIHQLEYPDAANRVAGTGEITGATPKDYDVAKQNDDDSLWLLLSTAGPTWSQISTGTGTFTFPGNVVIAGDLAVNGGNITCTAQLAIGAETTSHALAANGDLVCAKLEANDTAYFDSYVQISSGFTVYSSTTAGLVLQPRNTAQTVNSGVISLGSSNNHLLICEYGDIGFNFAHTLQTNPTLFIHSANQSTTEYISFTHDQTDGVISVGTGRIKLNGDAEVVGKLYQDDDIIFSSNRLVYTGSSGAAFQPYNTSQTSAAGFLTTGTASESIIICQYADRVYNFAHALATNPTLIIHSANQSTTEYLALTHNQTNAEITAGSGGLFINSPLLGKVDAITATSETVAASVATIITEITTNGDVDLDNVSLANGVDGQIKIFAIVAVGNAGDSVKITPASMIGGTQITFAASPLGLGCTMVYDSGAGGWIVVGNNGGVIA